MNIQLLRLFDTIIEYNNFLFNFDYYYHIIYNIPI